MKLTLVVLTAGKQEGKALPIGLPQFLIGRDPQCHLRPASAAISKRHCALIQRDGKVFVRDFDSTNGTFVNDQPIKGEVELHPDDKLKVGPLTFGVKIEATTAVNRPTPPPPTKPAPGAKPPAPQPKETEPAKAGGSSDDESVAAMLLSLQDDSTSGMAALGSGEVPEGSTVMDMVIPPDGAPSTDKDKEKKPATPASTSNAAKAILEKYMKRPR
jgi:predicted component of type VI protein secretion system